MLDWLRKILFKPVLWASNKFTSKPDRPRIYKALSSLHDCIVKEEKKKGPVINFDSSKRSVGGNTGCNVFGGSYTASRNTISMTDLISTMRACIEDGRMQTERELLDGLRRADTFEITNDNRLKLYDNGRILLTFRGQRK